MLYQGALTIGVDAAAHIIDGEIRLEDGTAGPLVAVVEGNESWMVNGAQGETEPAVDLLGPFGPDETERSGAEYLQLWTTPVRGQRSQRRLAPSTGTVVPSRDGGQCARTDHVKP